MSNMSDDKNSLFLQYRLGTTDAWFGAEISETENASESLSNGEAQSTNSNPGGGLALIPIEATALLGSATHNARRRKLCKPARLYSKKAFYASQSYLDTGQRAESPVPVGQPRCYKRLKADLQVPLSASEIGVIGRELPAVRIWTSEQQEDVLSENVIRNGYQDKAHVINELSTARSILWAYFKHHSSLLNVSNALISASDRRMRLAKVSSTNTFKPPPRVTLTDNKREAWLQDLAKEAIPLRRLCRTIPHGVRGTVLLWQCLEKAVPIPRALWLAKCVGANELRAFRRKGISALTYHENEARWLHDWTECVTTFVLQVIESVGKPFWHGRMRYTLSLCQCLFHESLLANDQFLEWIASVVMRQHLRLFPIALLLIRTYSNNIFRSSKYALSTLGSVNERLLEVSGPCPPHLLLRLRTRIRVLENGIERTSVRKDTRKRLDMADAFANRLSTSNFRTRIEEESATFLDPELNSPTSHLYHLHASQIDMDEFAEALISLHASKSLNSLMRSSLTMAKSSPAATLFVLRWCVLAGTGHGEQELLICRILKFWRAHGIGTSHILTGALRLVRECTDLPPSGIGRVFATLASVNLFSIGEYLKEVIVVGALNKDNKSYDTQILLDMPFVYLDAKQRNLRMLLLDGVGISSQEETEALRRAQLYFAWPRLALAWTYQKQGSEIFQADLEVLQSLTGSASSELSIWLKAMLEDHIKERVKNASSQHSDDIETDHLIDVYIRILKIFEAIGDFPNLAEVLHSLTAIANAEVLLLVFNEYLSQYEIFRILTTNIEYLSHMLKCSEEIRTDPEQRSRLDQCSQRTMVRCLEYARYPQDEAKPPDYGSAPIAVARTSHTISHEVQVRGNTNITALEDESTEEQYRHTFTLAWNEANAPGLDFSISCEHFSRSLKRIKPQNIALYKNSIALWITENTYELSSDQYQFLIATMIDHGMLSAHLIFAGVKKIHERDLAPCRSQCDALAVRASEALLLDPLTRKQLSLRRWSKYRWSQIAFRHDHPEALLSLLLWCFSGEADLNEVLAGRLQRILAAETWLSAFRKSIARLPSTAESLFTLHLKQAHNNKKELLINFIARVAFPYTRAYMTSGSLIERLFQMAEPSTIPFFRFALSVLVMNSLLLGSQSSCLSEVIMVAVKESMWRNCYLWPRLITDIPGLPLIELQRYSLALLSLEPETIETFNQQSLLDFNAIMDQSIIALNLTTDQVQEDRGSGSLAVLTQRLNWLAKWLTEQRSVGDEQLESFLLVEQGRKSPKLQRWVKAISQWSVISSTLYINCANEQLVQLLCALCRIVAFGGEKLVAETVEYVRRALSAYSCQTTTETQSLVVAGLDLATLKHPSVRFLLNIGQLQTLCISKTPRTAAKRPPVEAYHDRSLGSIKPYHGSNSVAEEDLSSSHQLKHRPMVVSPFSPRSWEMVGDSVSNALPSDSAIDLCLFEAREI